jgi:hypothetical protein
MCGKQDLNLHGVNPHQALNSERFGLCGFFGGESGRFARIYGPRSAWLHGGI